MHTRCTIKYIYRSQILAPVNNNHCNKHECNTNIYQYRHQTSNYVTIEAYQ